LAFLTLNKAKLCKILIIKLVFEKNVNFFAKNCRKSQKIVIITWTFDWPNFNHLVKSYRKLQQFFSKKTEHKHMAKMGWATFWAIFFIKSSGHPGPYVPKTLDA
jgi:hypothetical protein